MRNLRNIGKVLMLMTISQVAHGVSVTPDEMAKTRHWVAARFEGVQPLQPLDPGLEVVANYDPVQKNARFGRPLRMGQTEYRRGLFCHAPSRIVVRLPGSGQAFTATVGVDSNEQTRPGRGSVVFAVVVGGREAFRSDVRREGMASVPIQVSLGGAKEFVLEVGDAGDGISCDQADWAEAQITLADGQTVWLDDLPLPGSPTVVDAAEPPFSFTYGGQSSADLLPPLRDPPSPPLPKGGTEGLSSPPLAKGGWGGGSRNEPPGS